jgi:hypothetical protein
MKSMMLSLGDGRMTLEIAAGIPAMGILRLPTQFFFFDFFFLSENTVTT